MSLASGQKSRPASIMDKKIHENPKYRNVTSKTNTGSSMSKYNKKMDDLKNNFKFKQGEIFRRMKVSNFIQLVLQVESYADAIALSPIPDDEESLPPTPTSTLPPNTDRTESRFSEVIHGVGEMDSRNPGTQPTISEQAPKPYLLLDVRDNDAFNLCHIIGATNFPIAMLSRAQNYFTKEVLDYINKEGKIIIVYDEDERLAQQASATMIERGVDNLFMLSGGMKVLYKKFPVGIIRGPIPKVCLADTGGKINKTKAKEMTKMPASRHEYGNEFSEEDLTALEEALDSLMLSMQAPSRVGGMSRAQSNLSMMSSASTNPWK